MSNKITYEIIKDHINSEEFGNKCKLLTAEQDFKEIENKQNIIKSFIKLKIECNCGEIFETNFNKFKTRNKKQCNKCSNKQRMSYNEVKRYIEKENGYKLISKEYKNCKITIQIQCDKGHKYDSTFDNFKVGHRCPICNKGSNRKYNISIAKQIFKENNCELLEDVYINTDTSMKYRCQCGNTSKIMLKDFIDGHRCSYCSEDRKKITNLKNNGVEYPAQNPIIMAKVRQTMFENNSAPASKQQKYICNLLNGELNVPVKTSSLDIVLSNKICIEYDGGGHNLNVILGQITQKEFDNNERRRNYGLMRSGWKIIKIISKSDKLPSDDIILQMVEDGKEYLDTGHHFIRYNIDNLQVTTSQYSIPYDFGKLRHITKKDILLQVSPVNIQELIC
jgi:hypothetical protein